MGIPLRFAPLSEHVTELARAMTDPEIVRFTRVPDPLPEGWPAEWAARFDGISRAAWAVVDDEGSFVGYAVTGPIDRTEREVEVGYAVAPHARGRGVATATLGMLVRWALGEGMERIVALISVDNAASNRVAARAGFTFEGVLRSKHHREGVRVDLNSWSLLPADVRS